MGLRKLRHDFVRHGRFTIIVEWWEIWDEYDKVIEKIRKDETPIPVLAVKGRLFIRTAAPYN